MSLIPEMVKVLKANTGAQNLNNVFVDFVHLSAISLRNVSDHQRRKEREQEYLRIINKYEKDQIDRFPLLLSMLVNEMETHSRDVLGELYMKLELGSKDLGQCFTPWHVAELMAQLQDPRELHQAVEENGFISIGEPACGAGAMAIATVMNLSKIGINPQQEAHVTAEDINSTAVHMAYVQLTLLGIPAVVFQRNTLTGETFSAWPTPWHILGGWQSKLSRAEREPQDDQLASLNC